MSQGDSTVQNAYTQGTPPAGEGNAAPVGWMVTLLRQRHSRLGRKLLVRILLFSMTLAIGATVVQLLFEYQWDVTAIHTRLSEIERSRVKSVANSLWEFDRGLTGIQLAEILELPDIARVELRTTLGEHFTAGSQPSSVATIVEEYPLFSPQPKAVRLGTLRVVATLQGVYTRLWNNALVILATQSIKTIFVSLFILLLVHALVTRRVGALATATRQLDLAALDPPRNLQRNQVEPPDELDDLDVAFHEMSVSLQQAFQAQRRVQERERFLSDAGRALVGEVGKDATFQCIARLAAPKLAAACLVFAADEAPPRAVGAASPAQEVLLRAEGAALLDLLSIEPTAAVETTGRLTAEPWSSSYGSYLLLPLVARGRSLGFLLLLVGENDTLDEALIRELGSRAALALDNATLLADAQRELAERIRTEDELRRSQEMFLQAQKMETLGRLVVGVAHDFNNLLSVVMGNCDLILYRLRPDDPNHLMLSHILQAADRGASLIRQLLAFGRKQLLHPAPLDVYASVEALMPILQQLSGERVAVAYARTGRSHWVFADRTQLEQVLMNLVVNARDAIAGDGSVTISCEEIVEARADGQGVSEHVALVVSDTGSGMDDATQARIFEPFFTTKESSRGTGLGLATVAGIVAQSGGQIRLVSAPGKGSCFTILLPRIAAPTASGLAEQGAVRVTSPVPLDVGVLLVDNDELVRRMAANALRHGGYAVLEAADAEEALKLVYSGAARIELILADVGLPKLSGVELARRLRVRLPGVKVVLMSGYAQELTQLGGDSQIDGFLEKPFGTTGLLAKVREVLTTTAA